jgi:hypothetical protein
MEEESEVPKTISPPTLCGPMPPQPPSYGALRPGSSQEQSDSIQLTRIEEALTAVNTKLDAVRSEQLLLGNSLEQLLLCWNAATDRENARTLERELTAVDTTVVWTPPSTAASDSASNSVNSVTPTEVPGGRNESYDDWRWRNRLRELAEEEAEGWQDLEDWIDNRYQPARQRANDEEGSDYYWPDMQRVQNEVVSDWSFSEQEYDWWQGRTDWWQRGDDDGTQDNQWGWNAGQTWQS